MSRWSSIPLQSYDLAQYAQPVACVVCGSDNRFDGVFCQCCNAPLAIGFAKDRRQPAPELISLLGNSGVGKSCYLGVLMDMLARNPSQMQLVARGAFSVSLQQQIMSSLARRKFPPATPEEPSGWMWVHCNVRVPRSKRQLELVLPDVSGVTAQREIESPRSSPAIRRLLINSAAALVLVDVEELVAGQQESEFFAMKLLSDLLATPPAKKRKGWSSRPVAIVLAKADRCDWALESPDEFARRYVPGLWRQCQDQLSLHRYFATSIASVATAIDFYQERVSLPLRIEPRGVVEPLAWVVEQLALAGK